MHLSRLVVRGYRNLADLDAEVPAAGMALLGPNGHGKTNLLEAIAYPVLFRSFRGAPDAEVAAFGGPGFAVTCEVQRRDGPTTLAAVVRRGRAKSLQVDGAVPERLADAAGRWLAVTFLPDDTALASGGAAVRRAYLDRMLALADREVLRALSRYRAALAQRNAALRRKDPRSARLYETPLAAAGARIVQARLAWLASAAERLANELAAVGEAGAPGAGYEGNVELADVNAWPAAFDAARGRDEQRGTTSVGPHRDDLRLLLDGRPLRSFGSTGQQRSAAIALRLLELETLATARQVRPALLVDDVFAELDAERQRRLAHRLLERPAQRVVTAPRAEDLPTELELPRWHVRDGVVTPT